MIIAALDTGMRQGEMLGLRFKDVDLPRGLVTLRGETTKSRRTGVVPIATARLRAVLEWLLDADSEKKPADALVFSDEVGEPVGRFRTAWITAVLKAHDVAPVWKSYNWTALTAECLAEFRRINLRWHDLRHEYASRLVEKNVPLAQVRDLPGHASIITTEPTTPEAREPPGRSGASRTRRDVRSGAARTGFAANLSSVCQEFGR
jgi:integrase